MGTKVEADRDLLFGILALQNGLIDQADLIAGFQCWTKERSRPMARILVERGSLSQEDRAMVDGLVRRHVEKHGRRRGRARHGGRTPEPARAPRRHRAGAARLDDDGPRRAARPRGVRRLGIHPGPIDVRGESIPTAPAPRAGRDRHGLRGDGFGAAPRGRAQADPDPARRRPRQPRPLPARGRGHRPAGASRASSRSTAWGPTTRAGPTMPCGSSAARASRRPSTASIGPTRSPAATRPSGPWHSGSSCAGSSTSATRSPTPTAAA